MLRSVEASSSLISLTNAGASDGRPRCLPRTAAAFMPALMRSLNRPTTFPDGGPRTLSRQFKNDFTEADAPCRALGHVRPGDTLTGFFAMKPECVVPANVLGMGIGSGHRMFASPDLKPICQFVFNFYGFEQYSVLVIPSFNWGLSRCEPELDFVQKSLTSTSRKFRLWRFLPELAQGVK